MSTTLLTYVHKCCSIEKRLGAGVLCPSYQCVTLAVRQSNQAHQQNHVLLRLTW